MHCKHCGFVNGDDDHRCLRCGRRLKGVVIAAPPGYSGANALAPVAVMKGDTEEFRVGNQTVNRTALSDTTTSFEQPSLFTHSVRSGPNIIPFPATARPLPPTPAPMPPRPPEPQPRGRKAAAPSLQETQGTLDFIAGAASKTRRLKTEVEAQVFCDQPVATPTHRFVASVIDATLILIGFGLLIVTFQWLGGSFGAGKMLWLELGSAFTAVALLYGVIWAIAGSETAGMRFTDLQLITFDGFPLDPRTRALRFASSWLSFCSGGLGLLWAVADEENLTWHDHISKTFPTIRDVPRTFVKQR